MSNAERAAEIGNIFCGNGLSHNQQVARVKDLLALWIPYDTFEIDAAISAHTAGAERWENIAQLRRVWAHDRGPNWQKVLVSALRADKQARYHRDQIKKFSLLRTEKR